jgi:peptidyl-prolyl cis-trans isomerase B (cyclophilin B)
MLPELIGAAVGAMFAAIAWGSEVEPSAGLMPQRLYNTIGQRIRVVALPAAPDESLAVVLLDEDGRIVDGPTPVAAGEFDLSEALPQVWEIRRTCHSQLLAGGAPVGSALVLQPMLTRLPPLTEPAVRPDGVTPYTKIIGWGKPPVGPADGVDPTAPVAIQPQVFSGLRVYAERDVVLHTTHGPIRLAMAPEEAPNTVWNFLELAEGGFYDGLVFHRIVPLDRDGRPFVIQGGDPTGTGDGDAGFVLPIEPSNLPHDFGVISMARDDAPDTAGCQFFICLSREGTARLDGQYCAFGYAVSGAETIQAIAAVELADVAKGRPIDPPRIERAELVPAPPRTPGSGRPDARVPSETPAAPEPLERPGQVPR